MGRILEFEEERINESLKRLEMSGYIDVFHYPTSRQIHIWRKIYNEISTITSAILEKTDIEPHFRVFIAYLQDEFNSSKEMVKVKHTLHVISPLLSELSSPYAYLYHLLNDKYGIYVNTEGFFIKTNEPEKRCLLNVDQFLAKYFDSGDDC
jgi:hypothetical protein